MKLKCSFISTIKDKEAYVSDAVMSIIEQSISDWEFVIVNDGSTDGTTDILDYFVKQDKRIKVITNKENKGIGYSLNLATDNVKSNIIIIASGDDVYHNKRAEWSIDEFKKNDADIIYFNFIAVSESLEPIMAKKVEPFILEDYARIDKFGRGHQTVPHGFSSYLTKVGKIVRYQEDRKYGVDYPFFLDCGKAGFKFKAINKKEPAGLYRLLRSGTMETHAIENRINDYKELVNAKT